MGFYSRSTMFIHAIISRSGMTKTRWEEQWAFMCKLGFSHAECLSMFKKHPSSFVRSKENVHSRVKFFTVKQNFELSDIVKSPVILGLSLEKRIIPRCNVLDVLYSNGLIGSRNAGSLTTAWKLTEKEFIEKFVIKYQEVVLVIVSAYKSQNRLADFKEENGV
ncbi:hypothetical protein IFM89_022136 [Coptis chinensis]|uniref:Mitochondrial transcription termination factor family protein n=1 Tax=Coptis chinensis TaxID=261450 RepID=A0A835I325_9MAGN|nr:hypothetical protein IFM89_022136 [Coptis chinensis]